MHRRNLLTGASTLAAFSTLGALLPAGASAAAPAAPARGLVVEAIQMPAWTGPSDKRQPLAPGDVVSTAQEVETAAAAGLVLKMPEGSLIRLGEKTRLGVQRLEVNDDGRINVRSELKLFDGFFRFATTAVAKAVGTREIDVGVRTATIGIRGTDFWAMTDAAHDAACLFEGKVDLATRDQGALTLDKPTAFWARFFDKPVQPVGNATPDQLVTFLKSTELVPGKGVAVTGGRWRVVAGAFAKPAAASALQARLRAEGYPAIVKANAGAKKLAEVRINSFATRGDAEAVLAKIAGIQGVEGRVALSA
ncbi:MAG: SPOR domain-containing protein [Burkholderiaceae bacterium]